MLKFIIWHSQAMLMQVLSMTQDQINGLPDAERAAILQLVRAFRLCRNLFF